MSDSSVTSRGGKSDSTPELSIVVPVFNASAVLRRCADSILSQDFGDFELLLVDDGSTDDSGDICDSYAESDPRVRVFHVANAGPSAARNVGLERAMGRFVQFVDADDELEPNACSILHGYACGEPDLIIAGARIVGPNGQQSGHTLSPAPGVTSVADILHALTPETKATVLHYVWNKWYRLSVARSLGLKFDTDVRLGEDFLFNCAYVAQCESVCVIDCTVYRYHAGNAGSLTNQQRHQELARRRRMDAALVDLYERVGILGESDTMLRELVGAIAIESLNSAFTPGGQLSRGDQVGLLRDFIDSEYRDLIRAYGSSEACHGVRRAECWLIARGSVLGAYSMMWAVHRAKAIARMRTVALQPIPTTKR